MRSCPTITLRAYHRAIIIALSDSPSHPQNPSLIPPGQRGIAFNVPCHLRVVMSAKDNLSINMGIFSIRIVSVQEVEELDRGWKAKTWHSRGNGHV